MVFQWNVKSSRLLSLCLHFVSLCSHKYYCFFLSSLLSLPLNCVAFLTSLHFFSMLLLLLAVVFLPLSFIDWMFMCMYSCVSSCVCISFVWLYCTNSIRYVCMCVCAQYQHSLWMCMSVYVSTLFTRTFWWIFPNISCFRCNSLWS